jgi:TRAP-type C4-dicarboxylate transport system substrate-binding protein
VRLTRESAITVCQALTAFTSREAAAALAKYIDQKRAYKILAAYFAANPKLAEEALRPLASSKKNRSATARRSCSRACSCRGLPAPLEFGALVVDMGSTRYVVGFAMLALLAGEARAQEPIKLRVGTLAIDGTRYMQDMSAFGAEIDKRTHGGVQLEWVSNGQLGDESAMFDLIGRGKLDGGGFSETGLIKAAPEMVVWRYPGLFRTYDEVDRATAALDPTVREQFAKHDLVFAMWADLGFVHVFAADPTPTLRDRLSLAAPWIKLPLDAKLFEAVTSGRARAWALPPLHMLAIGRVQAKSMSRLPYSYAVGGLVLSRTAWARMTAEQQATFLDVCREWQPRLRKSWRAETERGIATLEKMGVRMEPTSDRELGAFFEAALKSSVAFADKSGFAELMAKIVAARTP